MKERYLRFMKHGRKLSTNTIKSIEHDFSTYEGDLESAMRFDIEEYIITQNEKGMSTATVNRRVSSFKGFFQWQIENGLRQGMNPVGNHMLPKIRNKSHESITYDELLDLYNDAPSNNIKVAIALMGFAGLRIGEVVGVGNRNVIYKDTKGRYAVHLKDTKGGYERKVSLALVPCVKLIETVAQSGGILGQRGVLSENGLWRAMSNYFKKKGYDDFSPHGLRATFATISVEREVRVDVVRDVMGHTTLNGNAITSRYVGVTSVEEQAVELLERWS